MPYKLDYTSDGHYHEPIATGSNVAEMKRLCEGLVNHPDFKEGEFARVREGFTVQLKMRKVDGVAVKLVEITDGVLWTAEA